MNKRPKEIDEAIGYAIECLCHEPFYSGDVVEAANNLLMGDAELKVTYQQVSTALSYLFKWGLIVRVSTPKERRTRAYYIGVKELFYGRTKTDIRQVARDDFLTALKGFKLPEQLINTIGTYMEFLYNCAPPSMKNMNLDLAEAVKAKTILQERVTALTHEVQEANHKANNAMAAAGKRTFDYIDRCQAEVEAVFQKYKGKGGAHEKTDKV